jgi:hypothetical protein
MELVKLIFVETEGSDTPVIRPYETTLKKDDLDLFAKATDDGSNLSTIRLAKVVAPLLGPSNRRQHKSHIANGWDETRIMFGMVVKVMNRDNASTYEYIVGYTDKSDHARRGDNAKFDAGMKMYFNNITRVHMQESRHRDSNIWVPKIQAHDQILLRSSLTGSDRGTTRGGDRPVTLRPTDLFKRGGADAAFGSFMRDNDSNVNNTVGSFSSAIRASNVVNNSQTAYAARNLNAWMQASNSPNDAYVGDGNDEDTIQATSDRLAENSLELDPYLERIKRDTNILREGCITFGELMDMNADFDEDRQLMFVPLDKRKRGGFINNSAWGEDTNEAIAATIIANSLPGILINSMYSSVSGLVLNSRARFGEYKVVCSEPTPFAPGMSVKANWPYFESQIEHVLMEEVGCGGAFEFEAYIDANIDQFIKIRIRMDGGEEASFNFPAYASSLLAPTQDKDFKSLDRMSKGVIDLASGLSNMRMSRAGVGAREDGLHTGSESRINLAPSSKESRPRDNDYRAAPAAASGDRKGGKGW